MNNRHKKEDLVSGPPIISNMIMQSAIMSDKIKKISRYKIIIIKITFISEIKLLKAKENIIITKNLKLRRN